MPDYMMKIAVCDDQPDDLKQTADMTASVAAQEKIACELTLYESGRELLDVIERGESFHILLLDVMMPGMDGID